MTKNSINKEMVQGYLESVPDFVRNFIFSKEISKNVKLGVLIVICLIVLSFGGINLMGFVQSYLSQVMSFTTFVVITIVIFLFFKSKYDKKLKIMSEKRHRM